jgi:hypothetical protein
MPSGCDRMCFYSATYVELQSFFFQRGLKEQLKVPFRIFNVISLDEITIDQFLNRKTEIFYRLNPIEFGV